MRGVLACLLSLALAGCSTTVLRDAPDVAPPQAVPPVIEAAPASFDAGAVNTWESRESIITLWSRGDGVLRIESVRIEGGAGWSLLVEPELPASLAGGSRLPVAVGYSAGTPGPQAADLVVVSNDPDSPELRVPLVAQQLLPQIELIPPAIDLGEVLVGCTTELDVRVLNVGDGPLVLGDFAFDGVPAGLYLDDAPVGETIEPGGERTFTVGWFAADTIGFATTLQVDSNDWLVPTLEAPTFAAGRSLLSGSDLFEYEQPSAEVDVLFVVDNSCSMADEQSSLGGNFEAFVDSLENTGADYRIAATTTDIADGGALVGAPPIVTPWVSDPASTFASNVVLGTGGSAYEQGFAPASSALQGILVSPPAEGFLRPGARLEIIFVSDEPEQSGGSESLWVDELRSFRPTPSETVLSAITGGASGCSGPGGSALPESRYQFAVATTGGVAISICAADWGEQLELLGLAVGGGTGLLLLSAEPVPASVVVYVDGLPHPAARWSYVEAANAVALLQPRPADGAEILVQYLRAEGCEG